jgi:hypothetical protein
MFSAATIACSKVDQLAGFVVLARTRGSAGRIGTLVGLPSRTSMRQQTHCLRSRSSAGTFTPPS